MNQLAVAPRLGQLGFFSNAEPGDLRRYRPILTAIENEKGVLDVDTVKGCTLGMRAHPAGGCYGACYANTTASRYGIDFSVSVVRKLVPHRYADVFRTVQSHPASWYRIGTAGDPCHDWENTLSVCEALRDTGKTPVIITKHWIPLTDDHLRRLKALSAVINTSTSGLDSDAQMTHRLKQIRRIAEYGIRSVNRVVTCRYGTSEGARAAQAKQAYLLSITPLIDNPLRTTRAHPRVANGDILLSHVPEAIGGGKSVSLHSSSVYLGKCNGCPDQCGVESIREGETVNTALQAPLFTKKIEWVVVKSVLGSGYEADVSKLALQDGIAQRAARKNMQIHSAVILLVNGEFSGFMTFQVNDVCREFCLLQSVIRPDRFDPALYRQMVVEVIAQNTNNYPALITTDPKSKFETPALFESLGFQTYLKMSGFHYMVRGNLADVRMKLLAHITMTNTWNSIKGDWLRLKREWNARINAAGERKSVPNPLFATRDGCWQGTNGFANVVTRKIDRVNAQILPGRAQNGNASVLDPVACEVILRFFMPTRGRRVYNPFGGGVQFGFVTGSYGYEYVASEIRQNQSDANNRICSEFPDVQWVQSDSATYEPEGMFDLVFTCPPYYKVETYLDYDGTPPTGEINSLSTYEQFRDTLFAGYKRAIGHLNENCFFVVMTGDSRDKRGGYHCHEAETECFFKEQGLAVYNKIVYLEAEFTRLAHAKKTLNQRKFPKREQKIIVAYKGDIAKIKDLYAPVGRL